MQPWASWWRPGSRRACSLDFGATMKLGLTGMPFRTLIRSAGLTTPDSLALPHATFRELGAHGVLDAVVTHLGLPLVVATAVKDGDPASVDAATRATLLEQIGRARGLVEARAFIDNLRKRYTVTVAEDRL